jgi:hypothetical protein
VQLAEAGTKGPRVLPGTYTVRLHQGEKTYETSVTVGLDRRVTWTLADRQAQYEAAMKVYALFNDESALFGQIAALRQQLAAASHGRPPADPLQKKLSDFDGKLDALRKQIVATTEGGAVTGEERLREHTDQLYGAINSWNGPPAAYQLDNIGALRSELDETAAAFAHLTATELPALNDALRGGGAQPLTVPPPQALNEAAPVGGSFVGGRLDPDAAPAVEVPQNLRLWD